MNSNVSRSAEPGNPKQSVDVQGAAESVRYLSICVADGAQTHIQEGEIERRHQADQDRVPADRRDESGSRQGGERGAIPRGPVLPDHAPAGSLSLRPASLEAVTDSEADTPVRPRWDDVAVGPHGHKNVAAESQLG
jgi:hypothetical protein